MIRFCSLPGGMIARVEPGLIPLISSCRWSDSADQNGRNAHRSCRPLGARNSRSKGTTGSQPPHLRVGSKLLVSKHLGCHRSLDPRSPASFPLARAVASRRLASTSHATPRPAAASRLVDPRPLRPLPPHRWCVSYSPSSATSDRPLFVIHENAQISMFPFVTRDLDRLACFSFFFRSA